MYSHKKLITFQMTGNEQLRTSNYWQSKEVECLVYKFYGPTDTFNKKAEMKVIINYTKIKS